MEAHAPRARMRKAAEYRAKGAENAKGEAKEGIESIVWVSWLLSLRAWRSLREVHHFCGLSFATMGLAVRVCIWRISPGSGLNANSPGGLDPLSRGQGETVQPGLAFKGLEFDTFKPWVVDLLPNADVFQGVSVPHPIVDQRIIAELLCHVGQGNVVTTFF